MLTEQLMVSTKIGEKMIIKTDKENIMKILTNAQELIGRIEDAKNELPLKMLISESLIEIEKDGKKQKYRLREFDNEFQKMYVKMRSVVLENKDYSSSEQTELDNYDREIPLSDLTDDEITELSDFANKIVNHFEN